MKVIYAIRDRFHPHINGEDCPEVRSDNPAFDSDQEFFDWCRQHHAVDSEIYLVNVDNT